MSQGPGQDDWSFSKIYQRTSTAIHFAHFFIVSNCFFKFLRLHVTVERYKITYLKRGVQIQTTAAYCIKYSLHRTPCLIYLFQVVQAQTTAAYCIKYSLHWTPCLIYLFQEVQTQTTAAYCRILPTLDPMFDISFSGSSDTNHGSLL